MAPSKPNFPHVGHGRSFIVFLLVLRFTLVIVIVMRAMIMRMALI